MQIGQVAERTGLSINTLRHYDQVGLVSPSARSQGGFRLYTGGDVDRLLVIRRMKPLGFSLEEMRELLQVTDALDDPATSKARAHRLQTVLDRYLAAARDKREQLAQELSYAEDLIATMDALVEHPAETGRGNRTASGARRPAR